MIRTIMQTGTITPPLSRSRSFDIQRILCLPEATHHFPSGHQPSFHQTWVLFCHSAASRKRLQFPAILFHSAADIAAPGRGHHQSLGRRPLRNHLDRWRGPRSAPWTQGRAGLPGEGLEGWEGGLGRPRPLEGWEFGH